MQRHLQARVPAAWPVSLAPYRLSSIPRTQRWLLSNPGQQRTREWGRGAGVVRSYSIQSGKNKTEVPTQKTPMVDRV